MATMNILLPDQIYNEKLEALRSDLSVGDEQAKNGKFVAGFSMDSLIIELDQE